MSAVEAGHRVLLLRAARYRRRADLVCAVGAGLAASAALTIVVGSAQLIKGTSPWIIPRMTAAILLGSRVAPPPDTFDPALVLVAAGIHVGLSVFYSIGIADAVCRLRRQAALAAGLAIGAALYVINFYGFTGLFPWFARERGPAMLVGHLVFGAAAAGVYKAFETPVVRVRPPAKAAVKPSRRAP